MVDLAHWPIKNTLRWNCACFCNGLSHVISLLNKRMLFTIDFIFSFSYLSFQINLKRERGGGGSYATWLIICILRSFRMLLWTLNTDVYYIAYILCICIWSESSFFTSMTSCGSNTSYVDINAEIIWDPSASSIITLSTSWLVSLLGFAVLFNPSGYFLGVPERNFRSPLQMEAQHRHPSCESRTV